MRRKEKTEWQWRNHATAQLSRNYKLAKLRDPDDEPLRCERKDINHTGVSRDIDLNVMRKGPWEIRHNLDSDHVVIRNLLFEEFPAQYGDCDKIEELIAVCSSAFLRGWF